MILYLIFLFCQMFILAYVSFLKLLFYYVSDMLFQVPSEVEDSMWVHMGVCVIEYL